MLTFNQSLVLKDVDIILYFSEFMKDSFNLLVTMFCGCSLTHKQRQQQQTASKTRGNVNTSHCANVSVLKSRTGEQSGPRLILYWSRCLVNVSLQCSCIFWYQQSKWTVKKKMKRKRAYSHAWLTARCDPRPTFIWARYTPANWFLTLYLGSGWALM